MKKSITILCIIILSLVCNLNAQTEKFGKINPEALKLVQYPDFPDATAIILFDVGDVKIEYVNDGFQISQKRHVRIKILSKAGYKYADVVLPRYLKNREKFRTISANVFNLDERGKVVKEKVSSKMIFDEDIDNKVNRKRFTFPSVKEGTVIEYKYEIVSEKSFRIIDWGFQHEIPVKYSEFNVSYPTYFTYMVKYQGNLQFAKKEENTRQETIQIKETKTTTKNSLLDVRGRDITTSSFDINYKTFFYSMKNIPPIIEEPFMGTIEDYRAKLIHQYESYHVPGYDAHYYITDWEMLGDKMYESSDFYGQIKQPNTFRKELKSITSDSSSKLDNMIAIYDYVREEINWNGLYRVFPSRNIISSYNIKEGSSSDINLFLTYLLKKADFETYPVLISTREHGSIDMAFPILNQFNSVINMTIIDGENYFLDATDPHRPYNLLDEYDLYGNGFIIKKYEYDWISIANTFRSKELISLNLNLKEDGEIEGFIESLQSGYYSLKTREGISVNGQNDYFSSQLSGKGFNYDFEIAAINNIDNLILPLSYKINMSTNSFAQTTTDMIYLQPMLHFGYDKNPFIAEERNFPIDFYYSREQVFSLNISIPEGYHTVELPKGIKIALPENGGTFYFICQNVGNKIQLNSKIVLNKTQYTVEDYQYIKAFFDQIVAKQTEQIVLQKTN